ncbi:MAG: heme-binding protein [Acidobacteria bacterium]|nr:MAG: heme-binding protein [Acidobacteriota bacterium]
MNTTITRALLLTLVLLLAGVPSSAQLLTKKALSLEAAKKLASAAEEFARGKNWSVAVAILDDGSNLLLFHRMDGVQIGSIEVAMRKAESAIKFKRSSKAYSDGVATRPQVMILPGAFPFEGGLPIVHQGEVIGAIGVSGMTAEQDGEVAQAAVDAWTKAAAK